MTMDDQRRMGTVSYPNPNPHPNPNEDSSGRSQPIDDGRMITMTMFSVLTGGNAAP